MKYIVRGKDDRKLGGVLELFDTKSLAGNFLRDQGASPWEDANGEDIFDFYYRPYNGGANRHGYWHVEEVPDEKVPTRMLELAEQTFEY